MPKIFSMPKVRVSKDTKHKGIHDLSHDVSSTFEFGFCAPQFSKLMLPDSDMDIDVAGSIRLMPMPLPTFGRVSMKYYHQFVPMEDLWKPTNAFFSQQYYNPSSQTGSLSFGYVPSSVPYLYMVDNPGKSAPSLDCSAPSLLSVFLGGHNCIWSAYKILNGIVSDGTLVYSGNDHGALQHLQISSTSLLETELSTDRVNEGIGLYSYSMSDAYNKPGLSCGLNKFSRDSNQELFEALGFQTVGIEDCDMYFIVSGVSSTDSSVDTLDASKSASDKFPFLVCVKLTNEGRRLRKIFEGLGYRIDPSFTGKLNILPVFAYYKAWFDLMYPARDRNWEATVAYRLLDNYTQYGDWHIVNDQDSQQVYDTTLLEDYMSFFQVLLPHCYSTSEPNYVSMQLDTYSLQKNSEVLSAVSPGVGDISDGIDSIDAYNTPSSGAISSDISTSEGISMIQKLSRYITKNTIIGNRVAEFMRVHFNADVDDDSSNFIGRQELSAQIGDVFATADTGNNDLGQYAGQGYGSTADGQIPHFHFHSKLHGYYMVFASVEPVSNYVQSMEGENLDTTVYEFATPQFDALGYEVTPKAEIYCNSDCGFGTSIDVSSVFEGSSVIPGVFDSDTGFGYAPRYSASKVCKSKLLGDLSLKSTRDSYLGYTMDNWMSTSVIKPVNKTTDSAEYNIYNVAPSMLVAGSWWRYLGLYKFLNNYNRIFYNEGGSGTSAGSTYDYEITDDNFIVHSAWNVRYKCPLKSLGNSFDTLGDSNETLSLTKA